jgi:site-specific DNA recombinase
LSLDRLHELIPALRQREHTLRAELQAIADQATDGATFLRLAETLTAFVERQRIVRLVVKEILIGDDRIVIRHCIPVAPTPTPDSGSPATGRPLARVYRGFLVSNCFMEQSWQRFV